MAVKLHFRTIGEGPPVVVMHGLLGSGRNWASVAKRLSKRYTFYLVDMRNHGLSGHADRMTYGDLAGDVRALIDTLALKRFGLVGHSMGGKTAMTMALNDPRDIRRLVIIDTAPVGDTDRYVGQFNNLLDAMLGLDLKAIKRRTDADRLLAATIPDDILRHWLLQNLFFSNGQPHWRANLASLRNQMDNILGPLPVPDHARFAGETWFIRGGLSDRITRNTEVIINTLFANYRIETVDGGGHWPHSEAPENFIAIFERSLTAKSGCVTDTESPC